MYHLLIATPEKVIFDEDVYSLIAPGTEGYLEILTDHAPIITSLQPGRLVVTNKNQEKIMWAVAYGFLEVSHNKAILLVDAIELAAEIDVKRAEAALHRARQRLKSRDADVNRAKRALRRAENRIKVFQDFKAYSASVF